MEKTILEESGTTSLYCEDTSWHQLYSSSKEFAFGRKLLHMKPSWCFIFAITAALCPQLVNELSCWALIHLLNSPPPQNLQKWSLPVTQEHVKARVIAPLLRSLTTLNRVTMHKCRVCGQLWSYYRGQDSLKFKGRLLYNTAWVGQHEIFCSRWTQRLWRPWNPICLTASGKLTLSPGSFLQSRGVRNLQKATKPLFFSIRRGSRHLLEHWLHV